MALFELSDRDVDEDLRREAIDDRRRAARLNHWCSDCHGHTGPGSPCAIEDEPEEEESDFCMGCNPEPTMDEEDSNTCASCGKPLA